MHPPRRLVGDRRPDAAERRGSQLGAGEEEGGRRAMTMEERGDASVAGAGLYSENLGRRAMTMVERGDLGGEFSQLNDPSMSPSSTHPPPILPVLLD